MPSRTYQVYSRRIRRVGDAAGAEHLERLDLVEHVIAERLPIDVAPLERPRHEAVQVGGGGWRGLRQNGEQNQEQAHKGLR